MTLGRRRVFQQFLARIGDEIEIWCQRDFYVKLNARSDDVLKIPKIRIYHGKKPKFNFETSAISRNSAGKNRGTCHFKGNLMYFSNLQ